MSNTGGAVVSLAQLPHSKKVAATLCGICMFDSVSACSPWVCAGSLRVLRASSRSPKTCMWDKLGTLHWPQVCVSVVTRAEGRGYRRWMDGWEEWVLTLEFPCNDQLQVPDKSFIFPLFYFIFFNFKELHRNVCENLSDLSDWMIWWTDFILTAYVPFFSIFFFF